MNNSTKKNTTNPETLEAQGKAVIALEADAIQKLVTQVDHHFSAACTQLLTCKGRVIVTGMGKSGHIARKISATLASTGTPSHFVHPAEASHGDLGMLASDDVLIAISHSGETAEILTLLPVIKLLGIPIIAMTGKAHSTLAKQATIPLVITVEKEACPFDLAPTTSTTATLVMGDAIAITLLKARGFNENDFARFHPGGALGRRLLLSVKELMHANTDLPRVKKDCLLLNALIEITKKRLGMTTVVDENGVLCGIFTDGDLRRAIDRNNNIQNIKIETVMTNNSITISENMLAAEALQLMEKHKITALVIVDNHKPIGVVHMHDLLRAGIS